MTLAFHWKTYIGMRWGRLNGLTFLADSLRRAGLEAHAQTQTEITRRVIRLLP